MESIQIALQDLPSKDLFTLLFSLAAFVISLIGLRRSSIERDRVFRSTLTDVLNKLMDSNIEFAKLQHDYASDQIYTNFIGSIFSQRNGFLVDQATYIASRIPTLVRTYELNTLATAHANQANFAEAEAHYKKAIQIAPNDIQMGQATRTFAQFLYAQGRFDEGRTEFKKAIAAFKREDNTAYYNQGLCYQSWWFGEKSFNRSPETAEEHFNKAREKFKMIDNKQWRERALSDLEASRNPTVGPQQHAPNAPVTTQGLPPSGGPYS